MNRQETIYNPFNYNHQQVVGYGSAPLQSSQHYNNNNNNNNGLSRNNLAVQTRRRVEVEEEEEQQLQHHQQLQLQQQQQQQTTDSSNLYEIFMCSFCSKSFNRLGHFDRHVRMHTGERPFPCLHPGCDKSFSRKDNMMQHYKCHSSGGYIAKREQKVSKCKRGSNGGAGASSKRVLKRKVEVDEKVEQEQLEGDYQVGSISSINTASSSSTLLGVKKNKRSKTYEAGQNLMNKVVKEEEEEEEEEEDTTNDPNLSSSSYSNSPSPSYDFPSSSSSNPLFNQCTKQPSSFSSSSTSSAYYHQNDSFAPLLQNSIYKQEQEELSNEIMTNPLSSFNFTQPLHQQNFSVGSIYNSIVPHFNQQLKADRLITPTSSSSSSSSSTNTTNASLLQANIEDDSSFSSSSSDVVTPPYYYSMAFQQPPTACLPSVSHLPIQQEICLPLVIDQTFFQHPQQQQQQQQQQQPQQTDSVSLYYNNNPYNYR